jgi:hypothetical protein
VERGRDRRDEKKADEDQHRREVPLAPDRQDLEDEREQEKVKHRGKEGAAEQPQVQKKKRHVPECGQVQSGVRQGGGRAAPEPEEKEAEHASVGEQGGQLQVVREEQGDRGQEGQRPDGQKTFAPEWKRGWTGARHAAPSAVLDPTTTG